MTKEPLLNYWYRALHSSHGISVTVSDIESVRMRLYAVRREAQDKDLEHISVCVSPLDPSRLWLVKRKKPDDA